MKDRHIWALVLACLGLIFFALVYSVYLTSTSSNNDRLTTVVQIQRSIEVCSSVPPVKEVQVWWESNPILRQVVDVDRARQDGFFWCVLTDVGTPLFPGEGDLFVSGFEAEVTAWRVDETGGVVARPFIFERVMSKLPERVYALRQKSVARLLDSVE